MQTIGIVAIALTLWLIIPILIAVITIGVITVVVYLIVRDNNAAKQVKTDN